jgi:hypothetical protein
LLFFTNKQKRKNGISQLYTYTNYRQYNTSLLNVINQIANNSTKNCKPYRFLTFQYQIDPESQKEHRYIKALTHEIDGIQLIRPEQIQEGNKDGELVGQLPLPADPKKEKDAAAEGQYIKAVNEPDPQKDILHSKKRRNQDAVEILLVGYMLSLNRETISCLQTPGNIPVPELVWINLNYFRKIRHQIPDHAKKEEHSGYKEECLPGRKILFGVLHRFHKSQSLKKQ